MITPRLHPIDVVGGDPQRRVLRILGDRRRQIRARVEQVVLDAQQCGAHRLIGFAQRDRDTDRGVGLFDIGIGHQSRIGLGYAREVAEPGRSVVAGTGVNASDVHCHGSNCTGVDDAAILASAGVQIGRTGPVSSLH